MQLLIQYLIKLSISLSVVWLFYQLVLRRLTFYNWNRWFLLGYSLLAFFIPFVNISSALERAELVNNKVVRSIPVVEKFTTSEKSFSMDQWDWTFLILVTGCLVLLVRFVIQHISFLHLRRSAKLVLLSRVKLYQVDKQIIPFSFGDSIFINQHQHSDEDLKEIIRHEFVHVKQKHSMDMLCAEWLCILNWYNPFVWLIRHAIRQNLEFIADNKVVQNGIDKKQYQYLLLKVMGIPQYSIATNFNFSSLKKRIAMMNKMRTAKVHLMKFLFVLPLVAVMLLAFRNKISNQVKERVIMNPIVRDTIPDRPTRPVKPVLPKNVASIASINNEVTVTLKNGTKEKYNFNNPEEQAAFEKKYGPMPEPPEPPELSEIETNGPVLPPSPPLPPAVASLPANVSSIDIVNEKATIGLKNGKVEKYNLSKPEEKKAFEKKYGNARPAPSAVPLAPLAPVVSTTITVTDIEPATDIIAPVVSVPPVKTTVSTDVIDVPPALKEELITEIIPQMNNEKIDQLKKQLLQKGYTFSVNNLNYVNGLLQSIEGTIADGSSKSRFVADDFSRVIITKITHKNGRSGFSIRIY